jgi:hypothetical protein
MTLPELRSKFHFPIEFGHQTKEYADNLEAELLRMKAGLDSTLASLAAYHKTAKCVWCSHTKSVCYLEEVLKGLKD